MATKNQKEKAQLDFALNKLSISEVAEKYDVPRSTAQGWREEIKDKLEQTKLSEAQQFMSEIADYGHELLAAFKSQLKVLGDENLNRQMMSKDGGSDDLVKLFTFHADRFGILVMLVRGANAEAGPGQDSEALPS